MTPYIFIFICVFGFSIIMPYTTAKYRGRVYGMGPSTSGEKRRRAQLDYELKHAYMLAVRREKPEITIWDSDFRNGNQPNICEFCKNLNSTWFHKIKNSQNDLHLSRVDLQKIKEMYMVYVYTNEKDKFPYTWRDPNEWRDKNGTPLRLRDISEEEINRFYFRRCPQPMVSIIDVISFIGTVMAAFGGIVLTAAICASI